MSKFERMSQKYPIITPTTGYEIYQDGEFEISSDYLDFYNDYNALVHREIENNNVEGVYTLCSWVYYCDRAFPWYDAMLELALQSEKIGMPMLLFVLYMRKFWYEERSNPMSFESALQFANTQEKKDLVTMFLAPFEFNEEESDDDERFEKWFEEQRKLLTSTMHEKGVNLLLITKMFDRAKEAVQNHLGKKNDVGTKTVN